MRDKVVEGYALRQLLGHPNYNVLLVLPGWLEVVLKHIHWFYDDI